MTYYLSKVKGDRFIGSFLRESSLANITEKHGVVVGMFTFVRNYG